MSETRRIDVPNVIESARSFGQGILGAVILDNDMLIVAKAIVRADQFVDEPQQIVFRAMLDLSRKKEEITLTTLKDRLEYAGVLEKCGGRQFVSSLIDGIPRSSNTLLFAEGLADCYDMLEETRRPVT
jgi:replicative DNA helicase